MNGNDQKDAFVSLTARQFIAGSVLAALISKPGCGKEFYLDDAVEEADRIANKMLAQLNHSRREHLRKKVERDEDRFNR